MLRSPDLFVALAAHDADEVREALAYGADPNGRAPEPPHSSALGTALDELERGGPVEALQVLLRAGANVEGAATDRWPPLLCALRAGQVQAAHLLLDAGANPNVRGPAGETALGLAVAQADLGLVETLVRRGVDATLDAPGAPGGLTPLGLAAALVHPELTACLVEAGAALDVEDVHGLKPLDHVARAPSDDSPRARARREAVLAALAPPETRPVREVVLDGSHMESEADFHSQIRRRLDFPAYYGANLDALWDVLTADVRRPVTLVWRDSFHARQRLGARFDQIARLLDEVKQADADRQAHHRFDYRLE